MLNDTHMTKSDAPPLRVLLVEDHPDLGAVMADFLKEEGLDVRRALSGVEALEIAPAFQPQLVLCDLNLPDMLGLDVIRQMRSNPSTKRTYAVILTAMKRVDLKQPDVDAIMSKPITIKAVRTLVETARSKHT
jgi:CheY-like chemotaxis protein